MTKEISEYVVRLIPNRHFEVAKFLWHKAPIQIYQVTLGEMNHCTCPMGYRGECRHIELVKLWLSQSRPVRTYFMNDVGQWSWFKEKRKWNQKIPRARAAG